MRKSPVLFAPTRLASLAAGLASMPGNTDAGEAGRAGRSPAAAPVVIDGFEDDKLPGWGRAA